MRIMVMSLGTRGDVEPLIAIAEILSRNGHEVTCAFSEQYRYLVDDNTHTFLSLGSEYINILDTRAAKKALGGYRSEMGRVYWWLRLLQKFSTIDKISIKRQCHAVELAAPELIVHNGVAHYPFIWGLDHPGKTVLLSFYPYYLHCVHDHSYIEYRKDYGYRINKWTYKRAVKNSIDYIQRDMKHANFNRIISKKSFNKYLLGIKTIYAISPSLFSKPEYWDSSQEVLGFWERDKTIEYIPDENLLFFLSSHKKILLITLGSMVNPNPEKLTKIFIDILQEHNIPTIIVTNSGGFVVPQVYNQNLLYFIESIPYSWILPRVYGMIHHGGSGTVHSSLKHGCASMAIPHILDQFMWNRIIYKKGLGPKGVSISKLNKKRLEGLILDLYNNPEYKLNAEQLAEQMKKENFEQKMLEFIIGDLPD